MDLPLAGDLSGEITPDPPSSEKYLYLMENGPVVEAVSFARKATWKDGDPPYGAAPMGKVGQFDGSGMWTQATSGINSHYSAWSRQSSTALLFSA